MVSENLILIVGQEGVGKSTTLRALAPQIPWSARLDGGDIAAVNPWGLDDLRLNLLWKNVADLTRNYWAAGFRNMVTGSFLSNVDHYHAFRQHLDADANTYIIHLCAGKPVRDVRRVERSKPSTQENGAIMSTVSIRKTRPSPLTRATTDICGSTMMG